MCKKNDCTLHTWGKDSVVENNLYNFENPVMVSSIRLQKDTNIKKVHINGESQIRTFERGRLVSANKEHGEFVFTGYKTPEEGHKKTNKKYVFTLPSR